MKLTTKSGWIIPAPAKIAYFPAKKVEISKYEHLRKVAKDLSIQAQIRLEWIIFYETVGKQDASVTARYFSISRKTFHKWLKRFKDSKQNVRSLEDKPKTPIRKRRWMVTPQEEARIKDLRKTYMRYGKTKLKVLYNERYGHNVSTWKIERVIRANNLYPDKADHAKRAKGRILRKAKAKVLIKDFVKTKEDTLGFLWHFDTIEIRWYGQVRYIFTALEDLAKIALARVYKSKASANGEDFLNRLRFVANNQVANTHMDNGSEFERYFAKACRRLNISQIFSRPHTPKDNPALERFNRTLQDEWLSISEVGLDDIDKANADLTEWLVEYNFNRPHQALGFKPPIVYAQEKYKVSPMWSASTPT